MTTVRVSGIGDGKVMTSTKRIGLGILIMLLGVGMSTQGMQYVAVRTLAVVGLDLFGVPLALTYLAAALVVIGFIIGLIEVFRK